MDGPNEDAHRADEGRVFAPGLIEARFELAPSQARPHPTLTRWERELQIRTTVLWLHRATPVLTNRKASWNSFFCRKSATLAP